MSALDIYLLFKSGRVDEAKEQALYEVLREIAASLSIARINDYIEEFGSIDSETMKKIVYDTFNEIGAGKIKPEDFMGETLLDNITD